MVSSYCSSVSQSDSSVSKEIQSKTAAEAAADSEIVLLLFSNQLIEILSTVQTLLVSCI